MDISAKNVYRRKNKALSIFCICKCEAYLTGEKKKPFLGSSREIGGMVVTCVFRVSL